MLYQQGKGGRVGKRGEGEKGKGWWGTGRGGGKKIPNRDIQDIQTH